ncbi:ribonuclease J [Inquilinus sp. CAU 1745]|uniref:ribonuclease J n=1 Tax=Inquilinus sp. CAU 1745 TaxID=3140369 RepID=UPI00325B0FD8
MKADITGRHEAPETTVRRARNGRAGRQTPAIITAGSPIKPKNDEILILPLGGCGAIGMNMTLYGHDGKWLIVDAGVAFVDQKLHPGVNAVMADPEFIEERLQDVVGLVVTHAHEDHIGAIHHLWPRIDCPIYATPFAATLLRGRFRETRKLDWVTLREMEIGGETRIGPFTVGAIEVTHSIPEPMALSIRTKAGTVLHTGDFKFDDDPQIGNGPDRAALRRLGDKGVLAMVCDSTNALTEGRSGSEASARDGLRAAIASRKGMVAIACFASNVARLKSIAQAAKATGRKVVLSGRSLWRMEEAARANGLLKGVPGFLNDEDAKRLKRSEILLVCTGTQGEERSAMSRLAHGAHRTLDIQHGDTVIFSAREIPGNEQEIAEVQDHLRRRGAEIVTPKEAPVHVSGHPKRDELREMYALVRPKIAIPVHGTPELMKVHGALARASGARQAWIPHDGLMMRIADGRIGTMGIMETALLADSDKGLVPWPKALMAPKTAPSPDAGRTEDAGTVVAGTKAAPKKASRNRRRSAARRRGRSDERAASASARA